MKTKNFLHRLLGVLLACVLVLGLMPVRAHADSATLSSPTNIHFDGLAAVCDSVEGADSYHFTIYRFTYGVTNNKLGFATGVVNEPRIDLSGCLYDGEYMIEVQARNSSTGQHSATVSTEFMTVTGRSEKAAFVNPRIVKINSREYRIRWGYPQYMSYMQVQCRLFKEDSTGAREQVGSAYQVTAADFEVRYTDLNLPTGAYALYLELHEGQLQDYIFGPFYLLEGSLTVETADGETAYVGRALKATFTSSKAGFTPANASYQWQWSSDGVSNYQNIEGANSAEFTPAFEYSDKYIRCVYSGENSNYVGSVYSNAVNIGGVEPSWAIGDVSLVQNANGTLTAVLTSANFSDPYYEFTYQDAESGEEVLILNDNGNDSTVQMVYGSQYNAYGRTVKCLVLSRGQKGGSGLVATIDIPKKTGVNLAPTIVSVTDRACVFTGEWGHEYCIVKKGEAANYSDSAVFYILREYDLQISTGNILESDTEYCIYERAAETTHSTGCSESTQTEFRTAAAETTPPVEPTPSVDPSEPSSSEMADDSTVKMPESGAAEGEAKAEAEKQEQIETVTATLTDGVFKLEDGTVAKNMFVESSKNGKTYFVGEDGKKVKNAVVTDGENIYVTDKTGSVIKSKAVVLENGDKMVAGSDGALYTGNGKSNSKVSVGSKTYITDKNGVVRKNALVKVGKYKYKTNKNGVVIKNADVTIDGVKYHANKKGRLKKVK